jgi:hypothetical protein
MSYAEMCKHGHGAPKDVLENLPDYQGKTGRHKCVVCAYHAGIQEGMRIAKSQQEKSDSSNELSNDRASSQ